MKLQIAGYSLCLFFMMCLQGCADVAMTGAQAVLNRHTIQKKFSDQYITMQAFKALNIDSDQFKDANIVVATWEGDVLLTGQVPQAWQQAEADRIVKAVPDVKQVYNLTTIESPTSTLTRMSDAWITTKVKTKLIASDDVDGTRVKVVTENGTVYLMGIVQLKEAEAAVTLASATEGVEKVVKMFSYMTISKS